MSIDKSLKIANRLARPRSVLTRAERLAELEDSDRWKKGDSIYGLPKVRVKSTKKRSKAPKPAEAAEAEAAATEEGAEATAETPEKKDE